MEKQKKLLSKTILIITILILVFLTSFTIVKNNNTTKYITRTEYPFTTYVTISLYDSDEKKLDKAFDLIYYYDTIFSRSDINSDIWKLNNSKGKPVKVSNDTIEILKKSVYYGENSNGLFDVTIGSVSYLWDFISSSHMVPEKVKIEEGLKHVDYNNIVIDGNLVTLKDAETVIDIGGISKGFIADKVEQLLRKEDVKSAVIDIGGNIYVIGRKTPENTNWKIGIKAPFEDGTKIIGYVKVHDKSIVTSGVYERFFYADNALYHHILSPKTGYSIKSDLNAVSIISDVSVDGDALSTIVFCLGFEDGKKMIESLEGVDAIFIKQDGTFVVTSGILTTDDANLTSSNDEKIVFVREENKQ